MTQESPLNILKCSKKFRSATRTMYKLKVSLFLKFEKNGKEANHRTAFPPRRGVCAEKKYFHL